VQRRDQIKKQNTQNAKSISNTSEEKMSELEEKSEHRTES
jgi:hypothetical protein